MKLTGYETPRMIDYIKMQPDGTIGIVGVRQ